MRRTLSLIVALPILTLAACAQPGTQGPGGSPTGPDVTTYAPDDVVLRVEYVDGFVPVEHIVTSLPLITVYGDGRVITEGPMIDIFPSPAMPNVLVRTIPAPAVDQLVRLAIDAGVGSGADYGQPPVADAPSTQVTVLTDEGELVSRANALGFDDHGVTEAQAAARRQLQGLVDKLTDLPALLGADAGEEQPYEPTSLAAVSWPWVDPASDDLPEQPEIAWPGPALPGEALPRFGDLHCLIVTGPELPAVLQAAAGANVLTPWVSEGQRWSVRFRPLLPEESTCADL
jgi:hypothetical protein